MSSEHSEEAYVELYDSSGSLQSEPSSYDEFLTVPLYNPTTDSPSTSTINLSESSPLEQSNITTIIMAEQQGNAPVILVAPKRGGILRTTDETLPWTGGNPQVLDRKPYSLSCLRPPKLKEIGPIRAEASKGFEVDRRLGLPGAAGSKITFSRWTRYVDRHLQLCGLDGVFYVPKKGVPNQVHYILTDWTSIDMDDVDDYLDSDDLDDYDHQNLQWSGQFLQDSVSLELWGCIEPEIGVTLNGVRILVAILNQYQSSASATIRNLTNQLSKLSLLSTPGENVETLAGTIHELASQIEGLGETPRDLATLVAGRFLKSSTSAFSADAMTIYKRTTRALHPISWQIALRELKASYTQLRNEDIWEAIAMPKSSTESALAAMQQEIAELKRKGTDKSTGNPSSNSGSSETAAKKPNPFKNTPAPNEGESCHKVIDGKECTWCGVCKRWIYGPRRHSTEEHKTKAELQAEAASASSKDNAKANMAANGSNTQGETPGAGTLSMTSGFWAVRVGFLGGRVRMMHPYIYALIGILTSHDELKLKEFKTVLLIIVWSLACLFHLPSVRTFVQRGIHEIKWMSQDEWMSQPEGARAKLWFVPECFYVHSSVVAITNYQLGMRLRQLGHRFTVPRKPPLLPQIRKPPDPIPPVATSSEIRHSKRREKTHPSTPARALGLLLLTASAMADSRVPIVELSSCRKDHFRNRMSRYCDEKAFLQTARIQNEKDLLSLRSTLGDAQQQVFLNADGHATWIIDSGASRTTTPFKEDFIPGTLTPLDGPMKEIQGIAGNLTVQGEGIIRQEVILDNGETLVIETPGWYIPDLPVRLFSPQHYFEHGINVPEGSAFIVMKGREASLRFGHVNSMTVGYHHTSRLPTFRSYNNVMASAHAMAAAECVTAETNQNIDLRTKLLLKFHYVLGHLRFLDVQWLGRQGFLGPKGQKMAAGTFTHAPKCAACLYGKQHRTPNPGKSTTNKSPGALKKEKLNPGDLIFSDQYQSRAEGLTVGIQADGSVTRDIRGGTLFCDAASGYISVHHQSGLNATETIGAKMNFERKAAEAGVSIKAYHTDNGIYSSKQFLKELYDNEQGIKFSGVSAQFQNGVAENSIKNTVSRARTFMMQVALRWPESLDERLWPLALSYAVHLHNTIPKEAYGGMSPEEIFTGVKSNHSNLLKEHPWGCPAYVLDPKLREGQKIPKWAPRSRQGQFLGTSPLHASSVGLIRNQRTGHISPQFHVVYDNFFETVYCDDTEPPPIWDELIQSSREYPDGMDENDLPDLGPEWTEDATSPGRDDIHPPSATATTQERQTQREHVPPMTASPPSSLPSNQREQVTSIGPPPVSAPDPAPPISPGITNDGNRPPAAPDPPVRINPRPHRERRSPKKFEYDRLGDPTMFSRSETFREIIAGLMESHTELEFNYRHAIALLTCESLGTLEGCPPTTGWQCPQAFKAKKVDPDMPTLKEVLVRPDRKKFEEAMDFEISTLDRLRTWFEMQESDVPPGANILPLTWTFKVKRYPDGTIRKYKARICVRGDLQRAGIDYFETYAPVVSWATVRMMLVNTAREKLHTRMIDFTNAFTQAHLDKDVYVRLPPLYESSKPGTVLKLNRALYGLSESPKEWFTTLKRGLESLGFHASNGDPCLFFGRGIILLVYVDDCILFSRDVTKLDETIEAMRQKFEMTQEEISSDSKIDLYAYLGVEVTHDKTTNAVTLSQPGLIAKVLDTCGMKDCNGRATPAATHPLGTDTNGPRCKELWDYASVVGMLMYICSNSRPDIQYAVHQCARFTHCPRASHEQAVQRILRYLQKTKHKGLVFRPSSTSSLDCYVDADFAGLWNAENHDDSVCVKSRTGFVITLGGCPVIWCSKLQTEIALSTTEAEYIALSQAMRSLLPLRGLHQEIATVLDLDSTSPSLIKSNVYEDNNGCIKIASDPLKFSARTKHIAVKYHFFRSHIGESIILHKIDTQEQIADIFTKGLPADQFSKLADLLMGWTEVPQMLPQSKLASNRVRFDTSLERECDDNEPSAAASIGILKSSREPMVRSTGRRPLKAETVMNTITNAQTRTLRVPSDVVAPADSDAPWIYVQPRKNRTGNLERYPMSISEGPQTK